MGAMPSGMDVPGIGTVDALYGDISGLVVGSLGSPRLRGVSRALCASGRYQAKRLPVELEFREGSSPDGAI
jgi:hypothetical protein